MASASGILGGEPAISLKSNLPDPLPTIRLERMVPLAAGGTIKRRATCVTVTDTTEPEWILRVIKEFRDTFPAGRLGLNTGTLRKDYFRQLLGGAALRKWDVSAEAVGNQLADFDTAINDWIGRYIDDTAYANQQAYMQQVKPKPYGLEVQQCTDRIEEIAIYMAMFPGAPAAPVFTEQDLKNILYSKMLPAWQDAFTLGTQSITDPNYTLRQLTTFFSRQERNYNRASSNRGGRGTGAGRGGGRGHGGRGRGGHGYGGRGYGGRASGYTRHAGTHPYAPQAQRPHLQYGGYGSGGYGRGGYGYQTAAMGYSQSPGRFQAQVQSTMGRGNPGFYNAAQNIIRGGGRGGRSGPGRGRFQGGGRFQGRGIGAGGRGNQYQRRDTFVADAGDEMAVAAAEQPEAAPPNQDVYYQQEPDVAYGGAHDMGEYEAGHWVDEQFGVFDESNYGYDDGYTGYGDY